MFCNDPIVLLNYKQFLKEKSSTNLRVQRDICDFCESDEIALEIPNPSNIFNLRLILKPEWPSFWADIPIEFKLEIRHGYPFKPPYLTCLNAPFHPNIADDGKVCLSLVREDWKPVYTLNEVAQSLLSLFYSFGIEDPLNQESAKCFHENEQLFREKIKTLKK